MSIATCTVPTSRWNCPGSRISSVKQLSTCTAGSTWTRIRVRRLLVADEVGLGKTMVARGVSHRRSTTCGTTSIASTSSTSAQLRHRSSELNRLQLRLGLDQSYVSADRLTLLAETLPELTARKLNFISFTPGTSFELGRRSGTSRERRLLLSPAPRSVDASRRWPHQSISGRCRPRTLASDSR